MLKFNVCFFFYTRSSKRHPKCTCYILVCDDMILCYKYMNMDSTNYTQPHSNREPINLHRVWFGSGRGLLFRFSICVCYGSAQSLLFVYSKVSSWGPLYALKCEVEPCFFSIPPENLLLVCAIKHHFNYFKVFISWSASKSGVWFLCPH